MKKSLLAIALIQGLAFGASLQNDVASEGEWPPHLQGVCTDGTNVWWSHTVELARTDLNGKLLAVAKGLKTHHGDLCVVDGKVYVAVNHGQFNTEDKADSWVYAYDANDLSFIKRWKVPELRHGAGGMTYKDGHFFVVGGLPPTHDANYVYEYTPEFRFVDRHVLHSGWTCLGIQTVDYANGRFYFGCNGGKNPTTGASVPSLTLVSPADLSSVEKVKEDTAVGVLKLDGRMWKAVIHCVTPKGTPWEKTRYTTRIVPASPALSGR